MSRKVIEKETAKALYTMSTNASNARREFEKVGIDLPDLLDGVDARIGKTKLGPLEVFQMMLLEKNEEFSDDFYNELTNQPVTGGGFEGFWASFFNSDGSLNSEAYCI